MLSILSFGSRHLARTAACTVRFVPATQVFVQHFSMSVDDLRKAMDDLSDKFVEARENIDDAKESEGSVYYAEDLDIAIESVQETLDAFTQLTDKLDEQQRKDTQRNIGLKMEQLKAELELLLESHDH